MICEFCEDTGWETTERGAVRCRHTKQPTRETETCTPLNPQAVAAATKSLGAIAFFPQDQPSQTVIGDAIASMCPSVESLRYMVRRAVALYRSWDKCGVLGLRQIVCARYRPVDGIESGPTDQFPEGLPSETGHDPLALPAGALKALPPGHPERPDENARLREVMNTFDHKRKRFKAPPASPDFKPITQADIDRTVQELRDKRAREEAGL